MRIFFFEIGFYTANTFKQRNNLVKTLIVVAHPNMQDSVINRHLLEQAAKQTNNFTIHNIYEAYPDWNIDVAREQALIEAHDNVILQFPIYWFNSPPLLKKWLDDVFTYGWAYGSQSHDRLKEKTIALAVTAGIRDDDYHAEGKYQYTLAEILRPFEVTVLYINAKWGGFFGFYGTETYDEKGLTELSPEGNITDKQMTQYLEFIESINC